MKRLDQGWEFFYLFAFHYICTCQSVVIEKF